MTQENITFSIIGSSIDDGDGLPFDKFGTIVSSYQRIITNTYLAYVGRDKITSAMRSDFNFTLKNLRKGSIEWDVLVYALSMSQTVIASGQDPFLTISAIVDSTCQFLKAKLLYLKEHGNPPNINVVDSPKSIIIYNTNGGDITISNNIQVTADKTETSFAALSGVVDGSDVSEVRSLGPNQKGFSITKEDHEIFNQSTKIDPDIVDVEAKIFQFDVSSMRGKMKITNCLSESDIDDGKKIPFLLINKEKKDMCVDALHSGIPSSRLKAKREVVTHASGTRTIRSLHILDIINDVRST